MQQAICNCNQDPVPCCCNSPILVDVAGNGFALTSMNDGVMVAARPGYQQTERAWTQPGSDDAWLVLDRDNKGSTMTTRRARAEDAARIAEIYNQGIADRAATFETAPRSEADIARKIDDERHPIVVVEDDGEVLGWAAGSRSCDSPKPFHQSRSGSFSPLPSFAVSSRHRVLTIRERPRKRLV